MLMGYVIIAMIYIINLNSQNQNNQTHEKASVFCVLILGTVMMN